MTIISSGFSGYAETNDERANVQATPQPYYETAIKEDEEGKKQEEEIKKRRDDEVRGLGVLVKMPARRVVQLRDFLKYFKAGKIIPESFNPRVNFFPDRQISALSGGIESLILIH